ncbi:MAG: Tat pathway signal protein [Betaproteobacteria bacterium RIFCSPLOWO2_12_FULL_65_110]|nr:MAG: Tat pathway signal protein [Betaproteobacteria bacterium RIFCSPLOWO2_02_FULL_65_20]OGA41283.1 MAG: Tat pathway signal protein [Betaproteobacteria bacterium RIFCSPLOWO2_12_FULL_65_110]
MTRYLFAAVLFLFSAALHAQDTYPSRPISIVVGLPPGGVADLIARPLAFAMEKTLKQRVLVENKVGATGAIGTTAVANAKPDGYTTLLALSFISITPEAERLFDRKPPYEMSQLAPIALISADPAVLVVRADAPWKTAQDFIDDAKKRPAKINYGSSGIYSVNQLAMEIFAHAADIKLWHIPYTGVGPAITALLGGQIEALASGPSAVIGQVRGGRMRALGSWGEKRLQALPDVPTFKELGYDAEFYIWSGLFAPSATPPAVMAVLRNTVRSAVEDPDFRGAMAKIATPISYLDAPEFQAFWDRDAKMLAAAVRRIGRIEGKK